MLKETVRAGMICLCGFAAVGLIREAQHPMIDRALIYGVLPAFLMRLNDAQLRQSELRIFLPSPSVVVWRAQTPTREGRVVPPNTTNVAGGELDAHYRK